MSRIVKSNPTRRSAKLAVAVATALTLIACGGGGGSGNTVVDKPGVALFTNAGAEVAVANGSASEFNIGGGGGTSKFVSYSASSSDTKVATVAVDGSKLKINGMGAGEATVTVTDSAGGSLKIVVKVPATPFAKLAVNVPGTITLTPGLTSQYKVAGGVAPYSVAVSNPNVVAVAAGRDAVSVTGANPGAASVIVFDAAGNSSKFEVSVNGAGFGVGLYSTAPDTVRMQVNTSSEYVVNGGVAPYVVTSSDSKVATGTIDGKNLIVKTGAAGPAILNVRDAAGTLLTININSVGEAPVPLYSTAPASNTMSTGSALTYLVAGGQGPYIASTSNSNVAQASIVNGNQLMINGIAAGVADVFVFDKIGASIKVGATVTGSTSIPIYTTAPESVALAVGASPAFRVAGGSAPYTVSTSNADVVQASITDGNQVTINGISAGAAEVVVFDRIGASIKISARVTGTTGVPLYTTAPNSVSLAVGATPAFRIAGGSAPYTVSTSNSDVVQASITDGNQVTIKGISDGAAEVVVFDRNGASIKIGTRVTGSSIVPLYTTAPESVSLSVGGSPTFRIAGGSAPYTVSTSNADVVQASITDDNQVTINGISAGSADVRVFDRNGTSIKIAARVTGAGNVPLYTTAPDSVSLSVGGTPTFRIAGGFAPYTVSTSNADVVQASITNGDQLTIVGILAGSGEVRIVDRNGTSIKIGARVTGTTGVPLYTTAPDSVSLNVGATPTFRIAGGATPYTVSTSNGNVAQASIVSGDQLQINGMAAGIADIIVFDANGKSVKVAATVGGGTGAVQLYSTAPAAITVAVGAEPTYRIAGGAAPYTVTSSNVAVATVSQTTDSFAVKGIAAGLAAVTVRDANGALVTIEVRVP